MDGKIEEWLLKLPEEKLIIAELLRSTILKSNSKVTEDIKWGNLTFLYGKKSFAFIYTYPKVDYVNLGFFCATFLTDEKKLFEGTGKGMRHIKIRTPKDFTSTQIKKWVKETIELIEQKVV